MTVWGTADYGALSALCAIYLRPIDHWDDASKAPVFVPPLDATEQAAFTDLQAMASFGLQTLTLATYRARKADVVGLATYMALSSPTAAQTQAAFKALVRVVGAMLKIQIAA